MTNILIGATGSIAAIKVPLLVDFFQKHANMNVKVVMTEAAYFFVKDMEIHCPVYREQDEWNVRSCCGSRCAGYKRARETQCATVV